jgi:hypothetical protein
MENEVKKVCKLKNLDQESSLEYISRLWHNADLQTKYEKLEFICQLERMTQYPSDIIKVMRTIFQTILGSDAL